MIPNKYLPLPPWRRWIVRLAIPLRQILFGQGYWYWDLLTGELFWTAHQFLVFGDLPIRERWQIGTYVSMFAARLANATDRAAVANSVTTAKIFKGLFRYQFLVRGNATGNLIPVDAVGQFEYAKDGRPYAMWGYNRQLRPKHFGLTEAIIRGRQCDELLGQELRRDAQISALIENHVHQ